MKRILILAAVIGAMATGTSSFAQTATPRINQRQTNQQHRIANGVRSGQLTPRETVKLENREASLQRHKRMAKADGVVTRRERRGLRREENRNSRAIFRQKHDVQAR